MSTWDAMTPSEYADCIDAGRGPVRDVRDEADQLRKELRENGVIPEPTCEHGVTLPKLVGGGYLAACYCDRSTK